MCGIVGIFDPARRGTADLKQRLAPMTEIIAHRGPDADGLWIDAEAGIGLGHRRLSIVDVTSAGAQPMASADGRWITTYNGELYNTADLRAEVERANPDVRWRGHSDTEVLLEAVALWGVAEAIKRCNGMFALAFWDRRERRLWLVRDRIGIKPLYWARLPGGGLLFGSELRAFRGCPEFNARIDTEAVSAYLRSACIPAPHTIYEDTYKLLPGHLLCAEAGKEPKVTCYWDLRQIAVDGQCRIEGRSQEELAEELEGLLADAVVRQMVSDVPLGALLSGGIDSSLVVALMQAKSSRAVRTFTIGFRDNRYNEADDARRVAEHLGTEHTELIVEPAVAQATIARLPEIYDEPFAELLADSHISRFRARAPVGHRRTVRRWRRRRIWRICAPPLDQSAQRLELLRAQAVVAPGWRRPATALAGSLGLDSEPAAGAAAADLRRGQDLQGRRARGGGKHRADLSANHRAMGRAFARANTDKRTARGVG